ncbi:MAG: DUF1461 domain-containing protein [Oscillospiraceae bacterium]|jgi:hypothetical protein|nr:DUF1461 domain-containing protein [Oscillospiraceae bacterium]
MRNAVRIILSAVASFILILCMMFTCVELVLNDRAFLQSALERTSYVNNMKMSLEDKTRAILTLTDYMQGRTDSIDVEVTLNGKRVDMYAMEIEHTHMEEVRSLWIALRQCRNWGLLVSVLLYLSAFLSGVGVVRGNRVQESGVPVSRAFSSLALSPYMKGYLFGLLGVLLFGLAVGIFALADFGEFWIFFHEVVFPESETWLLPYRSRMIQLLPEQFFAEVVARIAIVAGVVLIATGAGAATAVAVARRRGRGEE